jgi:hypothetical protein
MERVRYIIGAQMGFSLSLSVRVVFGVVERLPPANEHLSPCRLAHGVAPRLPRSQEVCCAR